MYPPISSSKPEIVVPMLVTQVKDLVKDGKMSRRTALSVVVNDRYGGRFKPLMMAVGKEVPPEKPAVRRRRVPRAFTSGQYAGLAWDKIHDNAPVVK